MIKSQYRFKLELFKNDFLKLKNKEKDLYS